ncbi:TraC family protein [Pseudoalteromonas fenneropenaei]|uniref:TraC family protein n=1 Tax=Pseudoalteromonas fenneropenaei TaxID=1737459 RepID=A0ABV7CP04_9GAMM
MGIFKELMDKISRRERFSNLIPVVEYWIEDKAFILDEPAIGAMIICQPSAGSNDKIRKGLDTIFKTPYPAGSTLQTQLVSMPDIEDILCGYEQVRGSRFIGPDQEQVDVLANSIKQFYRTGAQTNINDNGYRFKNFEYWVVFKMPIKKAIPNPRELREFKTYLKMMMKQLSYLAPHVANEDDYRRRMNVLLNMYGQSRWKGKPSFKDEVPSSQRLSDLLLDAGKYVEPTPTGIQVYDNKCKPCQFIKPMSVTEFPENLYYGNMLAALGDWRDGSSLLSEHFILSLNIIYPDQKDARASFQRRKTTLRSQASGEMLQKLDKLKFQRRDFDLLEREMDQEKSLLVNFSMQMVSFTENEDKANEFLESANAIFKNIDLGLSPEPYYSLPMFLSTLPFGVDEIVARNSFRYNQGTSKLLTFLTPHMASWKGNTANPAILLASRTGQVISLDFFETNSNYNVYCAATSGAGKSFFVGFLTNAMLGVGVQKQALDGYTQPFDDGSQVFIVDVGRSYEGVASQYQDAQFITFDSNFKFSLNPFPSVDEWIGENGAAKMVHSLILTMAFPDGKVNSLQMAGLHEVLARIWSQYGKEATIDHVAKACIDTNEPDIALIGKCLAPFCAGGLYGHYFGNKYPPIQFTGRLIVCELEELKADAHLQVCALMSLIMNIQYQMYIADDGTARRKMFILDEAWEYLKEDGSSSAEMMKFFTTFLETGWRRFRKYGASGALVTQSVMDGYESSVGRAIIANSAWLLLMKQNPEQVTRLESEKAFSGSKTDLELLKSLDTKTPKPGLTDEAYSEVLVKHGMNSQVCRLYTDRKFQLILTTKKEEKVRRQALMDSGLTMEQAIEQMIKEEARESF